MEFLTETVKVLVEKTVGYTIAAIGRQMGYLIHYKKNVDNLNNKVDDLKGARDSVQRKVQAASYNVEEIEANVQRWQTRVQGITAEVQEFVEKEGQAKLKCFNLKAHYQIGKKAHKMGLDVKELKDEADTFHTVGHRVPIEGGTTISTKGYEDFESRKSIFDGVMMALKDDNIPAIGVCGMGGLGKTMLVGKIATQAMKDKLFERIVTVVVSQTPNLKQIQKDIAKELELKFEDEATDFQKVHLLRERLKKEKILLIVDDIWNKIDLDALGISLGDDRKGSKLLLTSRFRDVLEKDMDAEKIFEVKVLSDKEAKFLFVKIVGDFAETLNFLSTMVEVVKECAGLPIAITTVANTLKSQKNPNVWKDALQQLKRANPTQIKGMHEKVYLSIKFSYNFLSKEAQSLFLFCSSFEEDMVIQIDLLWRYLVGLDLFEDVYKMEEVRNRVHTLVEILKDSCLLLEGNRSGTFKMHDVIRDVAIHIADKEKKMLTIRSSDDSEKWSNMKKMKDSIGIALFEAKFSEFPKRLECPQLNFIILGDKENSLQIPNHIFEGAKNLKVLVLMRPSLPLPSSLSLLQNLQTLALLECESEDLALIGELKNLKALVLVDSEIKQLPIGIRQLTHLQLLDLRRCTELEAIPSNVLSNLKNLEEIHMNQSFNQWQVGEEITERSNARVSELDHLLHLTTLCIHIPNPNILPNALLFDKLVRYEILIGPHWDWDSNSHVEFEISRTLKIDLDRSLQEEDGIKILLRGCEYLTLAPGKGIKNILYEVDKEGFPRLKHLYVQNSAEIQYIIDSIWFQCVAFPILELLSLVNMINLEKICHNQLAMGSFHNLRKLEIRKCDNLVFVFSSTLLRCFSQLQEIEIEDCNVMSAIVAEERKHGIQVNDDIVTDTIDFPKLRSLNLKRLPNLKGFCSDVDSQSLFNKKVAFSNLENLHIDAIYKLKMLWHNQLDPDSFCKLKQLRVDDCENLINIFPPNILRRLPNLEDLQIRNCNLVEEVFEIRGKNGDEIRDMVVSTQFKVLKLINLPNLKHVWSSGSQAILTFQNLHEVEVSNCKSMKSLFPASVAKSLKQLKQLKIHDCGLEEIVAIEEGLETVTKFVFPQLVSLSLELMPDLKCFYPGKHTIEWPSLKQLMILKCDKVKIVALNELSFPNTDGLGHDVLIRQAFFQIDKVAFSDLEDICISDKDNLKMLWHNYQLVPDSVCKLKKLGVARCENLMNIFPPNMLRRLQNLENLDIRDCNSVEEVFDIRGVNVDEIFDTVSSKLRKLTLFNLPKLIHVWRSSNLQAILTFQNLHTIEVSNCESLKSLFPVSVAKSLEQLRRLVISNCGLEEIVAMEEGLETVTKFVFPRLFSLNLFCLPELKCFYSGKHTSEWPSLEDLYISKCDKVKIFASNELSLLDTNKLGHHVPVQQPLFLIEKAFPNLENIDISDMDNLKMLWHNHQLAPDSFCKLKRLCVSGCKNLIYIFSPNILRGIQNLEDLQIRNCNLVEAVFEVRGKNVDEICDMVVSTQFKVLKLINLPNLKHVWSSGPQAILTFQNLHKVKVSNCKSMKSLFPASVAKSLKQLKKLKIHDCGLEEIVAMEEGLETVTKFVFPQLVSLSLELMPDLKCFYPGKHTIEWPSLKQLMILKCDKVKIVALNELIFPNTDGLGHDVPIRQPFFQIEKVAFSNLENLHIDAIYKLKMLWHNQLDLDSFCKLKQLRVDDCENLINIFPPNILRRLPNLEDLQIRNCNLVEEVFEVRGKNGDEIRDMVVSTQFKVLKLINLPNLKHVWSSGSQAILTFQNLHEVEVSNCKSMKSLFPASVAKSLKQLKQLKIHDCGLEEIVAIEEGLETVTKFVFPQLVSLSLELMPDLKCFYPGKHTIEWPSLKQLMILKCDKVKIVALNELSFPNTDGLGHDVPIRQPFFQIDKVAFSDLEHICISDKDNLKMLWHNYQLVPNSVCKLKKLGVARCENLMNIFPPNMLRRLQNLENLDIRDCNSVEEVFDIRGVNVDDICDTVSSKLRELTLFNLLKLTHVWRSSNLQAILTFQNLHTIEVSNCESLKSLFPVSVAKSLEQLRRLVIRNCGLEEIVAMEEGLETVTKFVFPRLFSLNLFCLPELKCFYSGKHTSEWPSLEHLYISKCDRVKIFASNELSFLDTKKLGHHVPVQQPLFLIEKAFPNLKNINISDMDNLKMLWDNHQLVLDSFCKLKWLRVSGCKNLITIFPPNMLRRLQNLEELKIWNCNSVEEVFEIRGVNVDEICDTVSTQLRVMQLSNLPKLKHVWSTEEGVERTIKFVFPQITSLYLESLPEFKCFYPREHTLEWPSLKRLRITNCDKVKIIASNELSFQERVGLGHHVQIQQPLFPIEKDTLSNFEELKLNWDDTINQTYDRLKAQFSCKLKVLGLYSKDRSTAFPWVFVQGLYNLKELDISNFFLEEICPSGIVDNEGQYAEMFERLTTLHLSKMPKLMHLWKENSQQGRGIQNLESLHVSYCSRLKILVPSSMCFRNLYTLEVSECHGLISLATSSTVKSLVHLKELSLSGCKRLREIVTNEGEGEAGDEICFNQLEDLSLYDLPTLGSFFHMGNRTIKFPSLETLCVARCPELKIFSNGVISMQKPYIVELDGNHWDTYQTGLFPVEDVNTFIKRCWEKNNDTCLRQLFTQKTNASTSEAGEENDIDDLEDDSM